MVRYRLGTVAPGHREYGTQICAEDDDLLLESMRLILALIRTYRHGAMRLPDLASESVSHPGI